MMQCHKLDHISSEKLLVCCSAGTGKFILCWTFLTMLSMLVDPFRFWVMVEPEHVHSSHCVVEDSDGAELRGFI